MRKNKLGNLVYGIYPVKHLLEKRPSSISNAKILSNTKSKLLISINDVLKKNNIKTDLVSRSELDHLSGSVNHQGILLFTQNSNQPTINDLESLAISRGKDFKALILDGIQDPRNLGACIRTADAAGIDAVIITKNRSANMTPAAVKSAAGANESIMVVKVTNLANTIRFLKDLGVEIVGTDISASSSVFDHSLSSPIAVVLGSEGKGIRRLTRDLCDKLIYIPMHGKVSSLNVSVATGVILYKINID